MYVYIVCVYILEVVKLFRYILNIIYYSVSIYNINNTLFILPTDISSNSVMPT